MSFIDTSGWYASLLPSEERHADAVAWLATHPGPHLTTDYVLDETLTLLRSRGRNHVAQAFGKRMFENPPAQVYFLEEVDIRSAWLTFARYRDKEWSFTDCTSKIVMERFGVREAFTFDHHFRQFGAIVVPGT